MAFSFTTVDEFVRCTPLENKQQLLDLTAQAAEAYQDLTTARVGLAEVEGVMDNIYQAMEAISKDEVGPESLEMLELDRVFPDIENLSRAEALEGLGEKLKKAWDAIVNWITGIFKAIWNFLKALVGLGPKTAEKCAEVEKTVKEAPAEKVQEAIKEQPVPVVMTPEEAKVNDEVQKACISDVDALLDMQDELEKKINTAIRDGAKEEDLETLFGLVTDLEKRVAAGERRLAEARKDYDKRIAEQDKKFSLAEQHWQDANSVLKETVLIKDAALKESQVFAKKMEEANKRKDRILKILGTTGLFLVCPVAGVAAAAYQMGKKGSSSSDNKPAESSSAPEKPAESSSSSDEKKKVSPSFAQKMKGLVTSMGKRCAGITKIFSKTRKAQEKQVEAFADAMHPVTKEEIEEADRHNAEKVNEELKKKQEEAGLETEGLRDFFPLEGESSTEGFGNWIVWQITSSEKILETIGKLKSKIDSVSEDAISSVVIDSPIIKYSLLKQMIDVAEFFVQHEPPVIDAIIALTKWKGDDETAGKLRDKLDAEVKKFEDALFKKFPKDQVFRLGNYRKSNEYKGRTLKDLDYSKGIIKKLLERVEPVLRDQKQLLANIRNYSGLFTVIKYSYESSSGRSYGIVTFFENPNVWGAYRYISRILFTLAKKLKLS